MHRYVGTSQFDMDWYFYTAGTAIFIQLFFVYNAFRNYHYVRIKSTKEKPSALRPRTCLIVPCKGLDAHFDSNLRSFFRQDYENYHLVFVVESESDPAYEKLCALKETLGPASHALDVNILVAGASRCCSQKIHNLLYAYDRIPADSEVLAFADSDICVHADWLSRLIRPLRRPKCGLTTGYRWFIPTRNNAATLALSAINAAVAQFLGNSPFNQAWGGSMAIRTEDFRRLNVSQLWANTLSDDLSLSQAVKRAGMRITFVPECLVASFESSTWPKLYEFGRRQFLITRVYAPGAWRLGFLSSLGSVLGLWGTIAMAIYATAVHAEPILSYVAVPLVFLAGQFVRAILRQMMAVEALGEYLPRLRPAMAADLAGFWLWSLVLFASMLSSAFGRTIRWRGIRYKLISPTETKVFSNDPDAPGSA